MSSETIILVNAYQKAAQEYADRNLNYTVHGEEMQESDKKHVIQVSASILMTRDKVGYPGGSFAQAVVDNDLYNAISRADSVCVRALKFFVMLKDSCQVKTPRL